MINEINNSSTQALNASAMGGFYLCEANEDPFAPCYTIEINDANGVRFLRRLLTIDVKNIHRGEVRQSFILNALGFITDFATVAHLPDSDEHYRVIFQSIDTLAWMHQVAKAFDVEIQELNVQTALIYGANLKKIGDLSLNHCLEVSSDTWAMQTEFGIILQGQTEQLSDMVLAFEVPQLNWMQAYTCSILVREPHAMDWMTSDTTVEALNGSRFVDFSDPSRVFIGRALTEARIRSGAKKKTVVIKSHMDSAQEFFDSPDTVVIANSAGEVIAKTVRVGLLGDSLIACVTLPADADVQSLLWIVNVEQEPLAYTIEEIQ